MRQWIGIVILATAGVFAAPRGLSAQEATQEPPPAKTEPGGMSKFFKAIAPDSLDVGVTKCTGCQKSSVNGGGLMGTAWELPMPAAVEKKRLSWAVGLALISEQPGDETGDHPASKESNLQGGVTLGVQYRLMNLIAIKGGVAQGARTWGFIVFSLNYNEGDKPPPPDKTGK